MRSRCSSSGPGRRASVFRLTSRPACWWCRSAVRLDGMPLAIELAAARLRSMSLAEPARPARPAIPAAHRGKPHRPGAAADPAGDRRLVLFAADMAPSSCCCGACRCSPASFDLDAAEAVCGFGDIEVLDVADLLGSLVDKSLVVAEPAWASPPLPAAGDHPPVRRRAARRDRRGRGRRRRGGALRALPVGRRGGGPAPDRAGPGPVARAAGRRPGEPAARRRARGRPTLMGPRRCCVSASRSRRYWMARSRDRKPSGCSCRCCERPEARADPALFAAALVTAALAARSIDIGTALQLGEQAVKVARQLGDERLLIESLAARCACLFLPPASRRQGVPFGQEASSAPGSSATMSCWARA